MDLETVISELIRQGKSKDAIYIEVKESIQKAEYEQHKVKKEDLQQVFDRAIDTVTEWWVLAHRDELPRDCTYYSEEIDKIVVDKSNVVVKDIYNSFKEMLKNNTYKYNKFMGRLTE